MDKINKDKIIEALNKYGVICGLQEKYKNQLGLNDCTTTYEFYGIIANEILRENKKEQ